MEAIESFQKNAAVNIKRQVSAVILSFWKSHIQSTASLKTDFITMAPSSTGEKPQSMWEPDEQSLLMTEKNRRPLRCRASLTERPVCTSWNHQWELGARSRTFDWQPPERQESGWSPPGQEMEQDHDLDSGVNKELRSLVTEFLGRGHVCRRGGDLLSSFIFALLGKQKGDYICLENIRYSWNWLLYQTPTLIMQVEANCSKLLYLSFSHLLKRFRMLMMWELIFKSSEMNPWNSSLI